VYAYADRTSSFKSNECNDEREKKKRNK